MQQIINSLAVLAFLGVLLLLFGCSTLLKLVRELQAALAGTRGEPTTSDRSHRQIAHFASDDGRPTFVLVVDRRCPACHDRAGHLTAVSDTVGHARLVALAKDEECRPWFDEGVVDVLVDASLLGQIGVGVTPTMIKYQPDGTEEWRRVVGSDDDLVRFLAAGNSVAPSHGRN